MERGAARVRRPLVVIAGIALGQAILYGPSLAGRRILLPLDILDTPQVYLPAPSESTWVLENRAALPRPFVPRRVESVADGAASLEKLRSPEFDPREVAYVEAPVNLPAESRGTARIVAEDPMRVVVQVEMLLILVGLVAKSVMPSN